MIWELNGIRGKGDLPAIAGTYSGPLVIMGSARCLWDDLSMVKGTPDYMAINYTGLFSRKKIKHWATKHYELLPYFLGLYEEYHCPTYKAEEKTDTNLDFFWKVFKPKIYTHAPKNAQCNWEFENDAEGSSSMFAVLVGLALGYDPIWLAGSPLDSSGCFLDPPEYCNTAEGNYEIYRKHWIEALDIFNGRVKSYSGFTRELLGAP